MTKQRGQQEPLDQLYFDGSAEPNPGGRMGAGWRLVFTDRPEETGSSEWSAARDNTNNRAEYLALIGALEQYLASGRPGPLQVQGDSQLVINQMTGDWGINNPALWQLNRQATALVKRIADGVRYRWIPREENQVADTLAGGQLAQAATPLVYAEHPGGAAVAAALAEQIATTQPGGQNELQGGAGPARRGDGPVFALAPTGAGDGRRCRGRLAHRRRLSGAGGGGDQSAGDSAALDGTGALGAAGHSQGPGGSGAPGEPATGPHQVSALAERQPSCGQKPTGRRRLIRGRLPSYAPARRELLHLMFS